MRQAIDLLVHSGNILTLDAAYPTVEAMAVHQGKIVGLGTLRELKARFQAREVRDRSGATILPGLIDPHCHLHLYAQEYFEIDLRGTNSFEAAIQRVRDFAETHPDGWLIGRGWDQNHWSPPEYPTRELLDEWFPDRPVYLERIDIHAALVNGYLLRQAGIEADTEIEGGEVIVKDGQATGLLIDHARDAIVAMMPTLTEAQWEEAILDRQQRLWGYGLVGLGDARLSHQEAERLLRMQREGKFQLWLYGMLPADEWHLNHYLPRGPQKEGRIHLGAFKLFADGTLGSRGAWLNAPYTDEPTTQGLPLMDFSKTQLLAQAVYQHGFQLCVHAIGDAANLVTLEIMAAVLGGKNDRRWRIEHCQMIPTFYLDRFAEFSIFPSVQPTHATSDAPWVGERIGERIDYAYPTKSLLQVCGHLALGTDFPVESPNPWATFDAAVFRQVQGGVFQPGERLSPMEALRGMTLDAATAEFAEQERGSLSIGKSADFIVVDRNPLLAEGSIAENIQVSETWMVGVRVFSH